MFGIFVIYPIIESLRTSLYDWRGVGPKTWVGLQNYIDFASDPVAQGALTNNLIWLVVYMTAPMFGLLLAIFLSQEVRGMRVVRALFIMPFVISQVVVGLIFAWVLNADFGLLNKLLQFGGFAPVNPLGDEDWAILAIAFAGLWPQTAYCIVLYLTGLTSLRRDTIEAARIDGARGIQLLWAIVMPQLRAVTFIASMVCIVGALRSFDLVAIMTGGGPYSSSTVLAYYMYEQTFLSLRYGYGSAIAVVLFALMGVCVGILLWRMLRREAR
jgi:multiple sugar transport system permease protein